MPRRAVLQTVMAGLICLCGLGIALAQTTGTDRLAPGTILLASDKLSDPNFAETVVLLTRRDADGGTMGVVLNRPADITLDKAFPHMHANADPVYDGGPVAPEAVQALVRSAGPLDTAEHVAGDLYLVIRKTLLEKSITERLPASKLRVFLGYAGWGPGQLENEVRLGAWSTLHGTKYVFDSNPSTLWQRLTDDAHSQVAQNRPHATIEACRCFEPRFWLY